MSDKIKLMKMISKATGLSFEWDPGHGILRLTLDVIDEEDRTNVGLSAWIFDSALSRAGCATSK
jgi:hypothetical protein